LADGRLGEGNLGDNEEGDEKENEKPKRRNGDDETPTREAETAKKRSGSPQRRIAVYLLLQAAQSSGGRCYGRTTTPDAPPQVRKTRSDPCVAPESCRSKFDCNTRTCLPLASLIK